MKKTILIILFFPLMIWSQESKDISITEDRLSVDNFINSFYECHDNPISMIPFFKESYYATYNNFIEHMYGKLFKYGIVVDKKNLKFKLNSDKNIFKLRYKIYYEKVICLSR